MIRILLAEDEEAMRTYLARALQKRALAEGMPYQLPRVDSSPAMSRSTSAPDV